jgi:hypothetical protein
MSAAKRIKRTRKPIRFEITRLAIVGWCFGLLIALIWMFLLGLFVGKGITPANINFAEIKKRMIAEGIWPGSGKMRHREETSQMKKTKKQIPLKDLEFYEKLANKKKAQSQKQARKVTPSQEKKSTKVLPPPAPSPRPDLAGRQQKRPSAAQFTVQLASFKDLASAKKFAARFKDSKPQATIRQVELPGKGRWYRVQVGQLYTRNEAVALVKRFTEKYRLKAFIVALDGGGD